MPSPLHNSRQRSLESAPEEADLITSYPDTLNDGKVHQQKYNLSASPSLTDWGQTDWGQTDCVVLEGNFSRAKIGINFSRCRILLESRRF